jgi:pyridoxine/pyridoxamine 5'-phosphate oxidase
MTEPRASRAGFPGYGITTDVEGMLPWSWAVERLAVAHNYWVATASAERGPHAMPVWGLWRDGAFVFNTGAESRKARNLAADPRVVVHLESGDEVVVLEGVVERVPATAELVDEYDAKYSFRTEVGSSWYSVRPRRAYAFRERDYPQSATRYDFD